MGVTVSGWSNVSGTADKTCPCGTWKKHWLKHSGESWPKSCSVKGCTEAPTLGAHISNPNVTGNRIVPMCSSCNGLDGTFDLKGNVTLVQAKELKGCG